MSTAIAGEKKFACRVLLVLVGALPLQAKEPPLSIDRAQPKLRAMVELYSVSLNYLRRSYPNQLSALREKQMTRLFADWRKRLQAVDFAALDHDGQVDYLLLRNQLAMDAKQQGYDRVRDEQVKAFMPFWRGLVDLSDRQRQMKPLDAKKAARDVQLLANQVATARRSIEKALATNDKRLKPTVAHRLANRVGHLKVALSNWNRFYSGYDPQYNFWVGQPYESLRKALDQFESFVRERAVYARVGSDRLVGEPIGRQALLDSLAHEWIPYSPDELVEIANREFAWCDREMARAAKDLGYGDDWRKAMEHVKQKHVVAGKQPQLIRKLAYEAIEFLEQRNLVGIPTECRDSWRMGMMTPARQRVNPYFTGGEVISVAYPTDTMTFDEKMMTMRGNNVHFSRATVHHELIPGHHLQLFMADRYRTHRQLFRTPFLVEGWALYWEMLLWDMNFQRSAEDRVGMLFWRKHRCARIIFSLSYHLEKMSAEECVQFLVDRVGHERKNAVAEVRRSIEGAYSPLYQAAYMLGGLQIRALRKEVVDTKKMGEREFHDAILRQNSIPVELIRASLLKQSLKPNRRSTWGFYNGVSVSPPATSPPTKASRGPAQKKAPEKRTAPIAKADLRARYERAANLSQQYGNKVFKQSIRPQWFDEGKRLWYRNQLAEGRSEFVLVDIANKKRTPAFDHAQLAVGLSKASGQKVDAARLPFTSLRWNDQQKEVRFQAFGKQWICSLGTYECKPAPGKPKSAAVSRPTEVPVAAAAQRRGRHESPDGKWSILVREHNLVLKAKEGGKEYPLTKDGTESKYYGNYRWSPNSKTFVAFRTTPGSLSKVHLLESSPRNSIKARLHTRTYAQPGDRFTVYEMWTFDVSSKAGKKVVVDPVDFRGPPRPRWNKAGTRFTYLHTDRGHQRIRVVEVDVVSGQARSVVDEQTKTFIDGTRVYQHHVEKTNELIWTSERDGWRHIYLIDPTSGKVKNQITKGEWVVRRVDRIDEDKRQIWFRASGREPDQDPYFLHHYRVDFDGSNLTQLTSGNGTHFVQYSANGKHLIDTYSRVDQAPISTLRQTGDGTLVCQLEESDDSLLHEAGWKPPEVFVAKGRDGKTDIWGIVFRPSDFDPKKKYPVIEAIYAGPHDSFVPKNFSPTSRLQALAELGFIVVKMDGMGTANRGKAFHDVCWQNLADAGFPDRILWIKALAKKYAYLDLSRVGIYGTSAGGQSSTGALLFHPDFYHVAVSSCGCHDNRVDKQWWNEQWMGYPIGEHYGKQSNVTNAGNLQGKLLLIVGEMDTNVPPESTYQVVDALIKADKDFDLLVVPGMGHSDGGRYGRRRRWDYFVRHLHGIEPPDWNKTQ